MGLGSLNKIRAKKVIGIDASTNSLAWAVFEKGVPLSCGEIFFTGADVFERMKDAKWKVRALVESGILKGDYIAIEKAIMVRNVETAISLAYIFGVIIGELMELNPQVHKIAPISWQTGIGNPNLKAAEKAQIQKDFPGKSKSWYQNKGREIRKARTLSIARKYFLIPSDSDNIGDAVGLALFASKTLTK